MRLRTWGAAVRRPYEETPRAGIKPALRDPRAQVEVPVLLKGEFGIEEGFLASLGITGIFLWRRNPRCRPEGAALRWAFGMTVVFLIWSGGMVGYSDLRVVAGLVWMARRMEGMAAAAADAAIAMGGRRSMGASVGWTW